MLFWILRFSLDSLSCWNNAKLLSLEIWVKSFSHESVIQAAYLINNENVLKASHYQNTSRPMKSGKDSKINIPNVQWNYYINFMMYTKLNWIWNIVTLLYFLMLKIYLYFFLPFKVCPDFLLHFKMCTIIACTSDKMVQQSSLTSSIVQEL